MKFWSKVWKALWQNRVVKIFAATPSREQINNASMVLKFARSKEWKAYEEYLCVSLGEAMEGAFKALKQENNNALVTWVARAEAIYRLLQEPHNAEAISKKVNQTIIQP